MSAKQNLTWIIIANSNICRIYNFSKNPIQIFLLKELQHAENKLRDIDLTSDKPGHYKSNTSTHGAYSQPSDPKEIKIDTFSREIAQELNHDRNTQAFKNLILIAEPHMNGLLLNHFNKHLKNLIKYNIKKDIVHLANHELINFLKNHITFED